MVIYMYTPDQLYILVNNTEVRLSKSLVEKYNDILTLVKINKTVPRNTITSPILNHLSKIKSLSVETFDTQYYLSQLDKPTVQDPRKLWEQWQKDKQINPIDKRTINNELDIATNMSFIYILHDAITKSYKNIIIYNSAQHTQDIDILKIITDVADASNHDITIGSTYIFILHDMDLHNILLQLTLMIYKSFEIIQQYATHYHKSISSINEFNVCQDYDIYNIHETLLTNCKIQDIINIRKQYITNQYNQFKSNHTHNCTQLDYILSRFPYEQSMINWNRYMSLTLENYLYLCCHLSTWDYYDNIIVKQHNDISSHLNVIYFDRNFYLCVYPCYNKVFKTYTEPYNHFIKHGITEHLLPNPAIFTLIRSLQEYTLHTLLMPLSSKMGNTQTCPIIYVLTRTCNRPVKFTECVDSIVSQHYPNLRHIVSYDNNDTLAYITPYQHIHKCVDLRLKKNKIHPNQYIDCLYDTILSLESGWVMVIDDDDKFMTDKALAHICPLLINNHTLITWMLYRSDKFIYPSNKQSPVVGEIGSCCYIYHSSLIQKGYWRSGGEGDFPFYRFIFNKTKEHIFMDLPLTGVNYDDQVSGWCAM